MSRISGTRLSGPAFARHQPGRSWLAIGLLAGGAILVGAAIAADGTLARVINGIGAASWVAGTALLIWQLRRTEGFAWRLPLASAIAVGIAAVVRPNDLGGALIGFSVAGLAIAATARQQRLGWAALAPAIYLPAHIVIAIGRSALAGATRVRVDPPPTAPVVPLAMVAAALIGGLVIEALRRRR